MKIKTIYQSIWSNIKYLGALKVKVRYIGN